MWQLHKMALVEDFDEGHFFLREGLTDEHGPYFIRLAMTVRRFQLVQSFLRAQL